MEHTISGMLAAYEKGGLSRRQLVAGLSLLAAGAANAQSGFRGNGVNHVSLQVSDLNRSAEFYGRVFGGTVQKTDKDVRITLGRSRVILKRDAQAARVDHFAIGVDQFNQDLVAADLKARGATPLNNEAVGFHVLDPDGYPVQVSSNDQ